MSPGRTLSSQLSFPLNWWERLLLAIFLVLVVACALYPRGQNNDRAKGFKRPPRSFTHKEK